MARVSAHTLSLLLILFMVDFTNRLGWVGGERLRQYLGAISAGHYLVFAGCLMAAWHARLLLCVLFVLVPILWTQQFLSGASAWVIPGIAGTIGGLLCRAVTKEGSRQYGTTD